MAKFEGTIKEFNKFIGPYAKLKVAFASKNHKKKIGKCEDCGFVGPLDAAHLKGKERIVLVSNILREFVEEDIVKINLDEFQERFLEVHTPIESTIRVLCKVCHRKYDNLGKDEKQSKKKKATDEDDLMEKLVLNQMNKSKAIKLAYSKGIDFFTNSNTIFSNIISLHNGWWVQPYNDKFKSDLNIILNDDNAELLYIFNLPADTIKYPSNHFKQRNDKFRTNCSDIYIPISSTTFKEKNGFDFSKFLVEKIEYKNLT